MYPVCFVVQPLSNDWLFATPCTAPHQASLSFTILRNLLKLMSIDSFEEVINPPCKNSVLEVGQKIFKKKILPDNIDSQLLAITTESMWTGKLGHNRPLHGSWPLVGSRAGLVSRRTYLFAKSNWSVHLSVHSSRSTCWIPARSRVLWQGSRPLFLSSQGFHSSRGSFCEARTLRHLWDKIGNIKDTKGVHSLVYPPGVASYKRYHFTETRMLCER